MGTYILHVCTSLSQEPIYVNELVGPAQKELFIKLEKAEVRIVEVCACMCACVCMSVCIPCACIDMVHVCTCTCTKQTLVKVLCPRKLDTSIS